MSRVEWSRYNGDDIEALVAMFLSAEFPEAERITPSSGDGGIDVLVKSDKTRVYQVKKFHETLSAKQKGQVERSVDRLMTDPRVSDLNIDEWHLVMPWDPTLEEKKWLSDYVTGKALPEPIWDGLTRCDMWAAQHPHIVDYYLHGGKERVQTEAMKLIHGLGLKNLPQDEVESFDISALSERLQDSVDYLRDKDPFYKYAIRVEPTQALPTEQDLIQDLHQYARPGLVYSTVWGDSRSRVQVDVYAKNRVALELHPIQASFTLRPTVGTPEDNAARDFMKFGSPLSLPLGSADGSVTAPGGLGGAFQDVAVSLFPVSKIEEELAEVRLILFDDSDQEIDAIILNRQYVSEGVTNNPRLRGRESRLQDSSKVLEVVFRRDVETQSETMNVFVKRPDGQLVVDAFPALHFYNNMVAAHSFVVAPRFGPTPADRREISPDALYSAEIRLWHDLAKALTLIQEHTSLRLRFPNISELDSGVSQSILNTGSLLEGERITRKFSTVLLQHEPGEEDEESVKDVAVVAMMPWILRLPAGDVDLGYLAHEFIGSVQHRAVTGQGELLFDAWAIKDGNVLIRMPTDEERAAASDPA